MEDKKWDFLNSKVLISISVNEDKARDDEKVTYLETELAPSSSQVKLKKVLYNYFQEISVLFNSLQNKANTENRGIEIIDSSVKPIIVVNKLTGKVDYMIKAKAIGKSSQKESIH